MCLKMQYIEIVQMYQEMCQVEEWHRCDLDLWCHYQISYFYILYIVWVQRFLSLYLSHFRYGIYDSIDKVK